jgi:hypothetical protein
MYVCFGGIQFFSINLIDVKNLNYRSILRPLLFIQMNQRSEKHSKFSFIVFQFLVIISFSKLILLKIRVKNIKF